MRLPLLLALAGCAVTPGAGQPPRPPKGPPPSELPWQYIPVAIDASNTNINSMMVRMCRLDWQIYRSDPAKYCSLTALAAASKCDAPGNAGAVVPFAMLLNEFNSRGCVPREAGAPGCTPTGMIFHHGDGRAAHHFAGRLASLNSTVVFCDTGFEETIMNSFGEKGGTEAVHALLNVVTAALGRPIWGAIKANGSPLLPGTDWAPQHLYLKHSPAATAVLPMIRGAFPSAPWAFVYGAPLTSPKTLARTCQDWSTPKADPATRAFIRAMVPGPANATSALVRKETECVAGIASWVMAVMTEAAATRRNALPLLFGSWRDGIRPVMTPVKTDWLVPSESFFYAFQPQWAKAAHDLEVALEDEYTGGLSLYNGSAVVAAVAAGAAGRAAAVHDGIVLSRTTCCGVVQAKSLGLPLRVAADAAGAPSETEFEQLWAHLGPCVERQKKETGTKGKKVAEGAASRRHRGGCPAVPAPVVKEKTSSRSAKASESSPAALSPALLRAASSFLPPLEAALDSFNAAAQPAAAGDATNGTVAAGVSSSGAVSAVDGEGSGAPAPGTPLPGGAEPFDSRMLPLGGGYPALFPLSEILEAWNPAVTTIPAHYGRFSSLRVFNGSDATDMTEAELYRRAELPFVVRQPPGVAPAVAHWSDDSYLVDKAGTGPLQVEVNNNPSFLFYKRPVAEAEGGRVRAPLKPRLDKAGATVTPPPLPKSPDPPTDGKMTLHEWYADAAAVEAAVVAAEESGDSEHSGFPAGWAASPAWQTSEAGSLRRLNALSTGEVRMPPGGLQAVRASLAHPFYNAPLEPIPAGGPLKSHQPPPPHNRTMNYLRLAAGLEGDKDEAWIRGDLPLFDATDRIDRSAPPDTRFGPSPVPHPGMPRNHRSAFYVVDPGNQRGIHCLFGERGITAEAHFDAVRNFIVMIRGRKRYVLAPPEECPKLWVMTEGAAERHSAADFKTPEGIEAVGQARALEVVLDAGDVLYLPTFWFHYIVSLTRNMVCCSRSGTPYSPGVPALQKCGFSRSVIDSVTENHGENSAVGGVPMHHAMAIALGEEGPQPSFEVQRRVMEVIRRRGEVSQTGRNPSTEGFITDLPYAE